MRKRPASRTPQLEAEEPGADAPARKAEEPRQPAPTPQAEPTIAPSFPFPVRIRVFSRSAARRIVASSLIVGLLCAGLGYASVIRRTSVYQASAILLIDQPLAVAGAGSEGVLQKLAALRLKYATLARTRRLMTPVAEKLNITLGEVAGALSVTAAGPSLAVFVTARSADPIRARDIANASAEEIIRYTAEEQEANGIPPDERVIFQVIDPAFPGQKVEPTSERARLVAVMAGVVGFAAVFGLGYLVSARRR